MKKKILVATVCALAGIAGIGVAAAQERGPRGDGAQQGECAHHGFHGRGRGMLKKLDTNNDGRITRAEFNAHSEEKFKRMDLNNDGVITTEELQQGRRGHDRGDRRNGQPTAGVGG